MHDNNINIASLNVRGFRDVSKRFKVFNMVNFESIDILFLQETHCSNIKEGKQWESKFNGKIFGSFGGKHSRGVGILLSSKLKYEIGNFDFDHNGRFIVLDIVINNCEFRLINVYMPNNCSERRVFIPSLTKFMNSSKNVILGGDFNFEENVKLDKKGGNLNRGDIGAIEFKQLKGDFNIVDVFRVKNKTDRPFTWGGGQGHEKILCRLDRFYSSKVIANSIESFSHQPVSSVISDDSLVSFNIGMSCLGRELGLVIGNVIQPYLKIQIFLWI